MLHNHTDRYCLGVPRKCCSCSQSQQQFKCMPVAPASPAQGGVIYMLAFRSCGFFLPINRQFCPIGTCCQPQLCMVCPAMSSKWPAETTDSLDQETCAPDLQTRATSQGPCVPRNCRQRFGVYANNWPMTGYRIHVWIHLQKCVAFLWSPPQWAVEINWVQAVENLSCYMKC